MTNFQSDNSFTFFCNLKQIQVNHNSLEEHANLLIKVLNYYSKNITPDFPLQAQLYSVIGNINQIG